MIHSQSSRFQRYDYGSTTSLEAVGQYLCMGVAGAFFLLVAYAGWEFGGVEANTRSQIALVMSVLVLLSGIGNVLTPGDVNWRAVLFTLLPFLGLLVIGVSQSWSQTASSPDASAIVFFSIYPYGTSIAIASLVVVVAAAILGVFIFSRDSFFEALLLSMLAIAVAIGFAGIAMRISGDDQIIRGVDVVGTPFARFVNRNNAAGFFLIGLSCGTACAASLLEDTRHGTIARYLNNVFGVDRQTALIGILVVTSIPLAAIIASASRGGFISATVVVAVGLALSRGVTLYRRMLLAIPAVILAGALVVWLGLSETTLNRFRAMTWEEIMSSGRIPHWIDATHAMKLSPLTGYGLGTYGYAYQATSTNNTDVWFQHADNEYVDLIVESGALGCLCLALAIAILAWTVYRSLVFARTESIFIACVTSGLIVHSVFDYAVVIPAVALPAVALIASAVVRCWRQPDSFQKYTSIVQRYSPLVLSILVGTGAIWSQRLFAERAIVEQNSAPARLLSRSGQLEEGELNNKINALESVLHADSKDAEGFRALGDLYTYRYRVRLAETIRNQNPEIQESRAWDMSSLRALNSIVTDMASRSVLPNYSSLRSDELIQAELLPARAAYERALDCCPRLIGVHIPLHCLEFLDPNFEPHTSRYLNEVAKLFPADAVNLRAAARLAWDGGNVNLASSCWKKAFSTSAVRFSETIDHLLIYETPETAVDLVWPDNSSVYDDLAIEAAQLSSTTAQVEVGKRLLAVANDTPLKGQGREFVAFGTWLTGERESANPQFEKILADSPLNTDLRVDFAQLLWFAGKHEKAISEIEVSLGIAPDRADIRQIWQTWDEELSSSHTN